jgi:hypothetical protein
MDVRGVVWAVALIGPAVAAAALRARGARGAALRCALIVVPIVASWWVARSAFPEHTASLEGQAWNHVDEAVRRTGTVDQWSMADARHRSARGFVWGRSSPVELPAAMGFLVELARSVPDPVRGDEELGKVWRQEGRPWVAPTLLALVLSCVALVRRPWRIAALLCSTLPFLATLHNTVNTLPQLRYLATGMIAMPAILGVGFAAVSAVKLSRKGAADPEAGGVPWRMAAALAALTVLVAVDVAGLLQSRQSASQIHDLTQSEPRRTIERVQRGAKDSDCERALWDDLQSGRPIEPRLYPVSPESASPSSSSPSPSPLPRTQL